jgi:hypothetical protein
MPAQQISSATAAMGDSDGYESPGRAPVNPTTFNPFAALGLDPATATEDLVRPAYHRAMRHRHEGVVLRYPATADHFPSQTEVQLAYDYLSAPYQLGRARAEWVRNHRDVFFPKLEVGNPGVFRPAAPTAARTATASGYNVNARPYSPPPRDVRRQSHRATAPATGPGSSANEPFEVDDEEEDDAATAGQRPNPYTRPRRRQTAGPSRPSKARRTAATGPGSCASSPMEVEEDDDDEEDKEEEDAAATARPGLFERARRPYAPAAASPGSDYMEMDDDEEEEDDEDEDEDEEEPPATPTPRQPRRHRLPAGSSAAATAASNVVAAAATAAATPHASRRPRPAANRSGGSSRRNVSVANPITGERITVGEWAGAGGARRNAVVAGFDARGRIFYRITNEDRFGAPMHAPTATATRFEDVFFRAPYRGMDAAAVRAAVDAHLRLPPHQRP